MARFAGRTVDARAVGARRPRRHDTICTRPALPRGTGAVGKICRREHFVLIFCAWSVRATQAVTLRCWCLLLVLVVARFTVMALADKRAV